MPKNTSFRSQFISIGEFTGVDCEVDTGFSVFMIGNTETRQRSCQMPKEKWKLVKSLAKAYSA